MLLKLEMKKVHELLNNLHVIFFNENATYYFNDLQV